MSFKDGIKIDAEKVFLNADEFAEEITYVSETEGAKIIKAVIVRENLEPAEENYNRTLKNKAEVYIANDEVTGVTVIDKKDDRVFLKGTEGEERETRVNDVLGRDDGMWRLLVGW
jgi:hypothetical protein